MREKEDPMWHPCDRGRHTSISYSHDNV